MTIGHTTAKRNCLRDHDTQHGSGSSLATGLRAEVRRIGRAQREDKKGIIKIDDDDGGMCNSGPMREKEK